MVRARMGTSSAFGTPHLDPAKIPSPSRLWCGVDGGVDEDPGRITEVVAPGACIGHRLGTCRRAYLERVFRHLVVRVQVQVRDVPELPCRDKETPLIWVPP